MWEVIRHDVLLPEVQNTPQNDKQDREGSHKVQSREEMSMARKDRWIQRAIKRPGRVKRYIRMKYGDKAFTKNGEIKQSYILKAIADLKKRPKSRRPKGLLQALYLAKRLETIGKGKRGK